MQRTDIIRAMHVIGELAEAYENMPEVRTPDGRIDHERTDALQGASVHLRNAELVLMQAATGLIPTAETPSTHAVGEG